MYISKTRSYQNISLAETKGYLKIALQDSTYDDQIKALIEAAVQQAEAFTKRDIVYTVTNITDYNICGQYYSIAQANIAISAITSTDESGTVSQITGYTIYKNTNSSVIKFTTPIDAHVLNVIYSGGESDTLLASLRYAIFFKVGELFDNGSQYIQSGLQNTSAFERLLSPFVNLS